MVTILLTLVLVILILALFALLWICLLGITRADNSRSLYDDIRKFFHGD